MAGRAGLDPPRSGRPTLAPLPMPPAPHQRRPLSTSSASREGRLGTQCPPSLTRRALTPCPRAWQGRGPRCSGSQYPTSQRTWPSSAGLPPRPSTYHSLKPARHLGKSNQGHLQLGVPGPPGHRTHVHTRLTHADTHTCLHSYIYTLSKYVHIHTQRSQAFSCVQHTYSQAHTFTGSHKQNYRHSDTNSLVHIYTCNAAP